MLIKKQKEKQTGTCFLVISVDKKLMHGFPRRMEDQNI